MKVFGNKVVVKEQKVEKIGDLIVPDSNRQEPKKGVVVEVGEGKWSPSGLLIPIDLQVGDTVLYPHYCQTKFEIEGEQYTVLKVEEEILVKL